MRFIAMVKANRQSEAGVPPSPELLEAIEWLKRSPHPFGHGEAEIEIRQLFEASDFGPEIAEKEEALREELQAQGARK